MKGASIENFISTVSLQPICISSSIYALVQTGAMMIGMIHRDIVYAPYHRKLNVSSIEFSSVVYERVRIYMKKYSDESKTLFPNTFASSLAMKCVNAL